MSSSKGLLAAMACLLGAGLGFNIALRGPLDPMDIVHADHKSDNG